MEIIAYEYWCCMILGIEEAGTDITGICNT